MTLAEATVLLGIDADEPLTEERARSGFRAAAKLAHPDVGGTAEAMSKLNEAYAACLEEVGAPKVEPACVCRGFARNPLCKARHEPQDEISKQKTDDGTEAAPKGCVCRGFFRNPLCRAHHAEENES